ncbi:MAG: AAA family ATPase [Anaerorhabdus sp.]
MKIKIAGAGAGKTTTLSELIIDCENSSDDKKNIYCITYTNNATECIHKKLINHYDILPSNIVVSTIHSFIYSEIIKPYYFLMFGKNFDKISSIDLGNDFKYIKYKIKKLEEQNILHVDTFSEKTKWILVKKSSEESYHRRYREIILGKFKDNCKKIFIDESQDIDSNMLEIIMKLDSIGIEIELMGDPKQDLNGFRTLSTLIDKYQDSVEYNSICHRCPQNHLNLSNTTIPTLERQESDKLFGELNILFEKDVAVNDLILEKSYDLMYIYKRNDRYSTELNSEVNKNFDSLNYELAHFFKNKFKNKPTLTIERLSYFYSNKMTKDVLINNDCAKAMKILTHGFKMDKEDYAKIINALKLSYNTQSTVTRVNSIHSIKGREGYNCLFILTKDLFPYLAGTKKDRNKISNALYVGLTRSLDKLTVLITLEIEKEYGRNKIEELLKNVI